MAAEWVKLAAAVVAICATVVTGCVFIVRALIAKDSKPVGEAMIGLTGEVKALANEFREFRESKELERQETGRILKHLDSIVQTHEVTLAEHNVRLGNLESPTPPAASGRKPRRAA
jgi:hypothetical protein